MLSSRISDPALGIDIVADAVRVNSLNGSSGPRRVDAGGTDGVGASGTPRNV